MADLMTADDFFTGLFAGLAVKGHTVLSLRGDDFEGAVAATFEQLEKTPPAQMELDFSILLHPIYRDSITVRDSLYNAAQRGLISLDNPEYQDIRFKFSRDEAETLLSAVPGGRDLFMRLAEHFIGHYHQVTA